MSAIRRAAEAIRAQDKDTANYKVREVEYADVTRVDPLGLELHDSSITLDDEDLTLTRWVQVYDDNAGIKVGDRLAVKRMRSGGWLATDVVGGKDAGSFTTGGSIDDGAVTTAKLADNSVTAAKIADNAIGSSEIADSAVTSAKIASNAVTSAKIPTDAVGSAQIAADAVGSSEIAAGAVNTAEIADRAVTGAKTSTITETKTDAATTPVAADNGKLLLMNRSTDQTVTIDGDLNLSTGDRIDFIRIGVGGVTFQQGTGATLNGTPGLKLRAQYSGASIVCVGTDSYVAVGDLSA